MPRRRAGRSSRHSHRDSRNSGCESVAVSSASPGPTTSCHQPPRGSSGSQTRRDAEMPPIATTTGAVAGPASRQAMDTDSSVPPKCSLSSPGTASTPSRTCTAVLLTPMVGTSAREPSFSLLIERSKSLTGALALSSRADARHLATRNGLSEVRSSAGFERLDGVESSNPQELAPFRVGGGCPGVFGPIPQPVSMSARILWGSSRLRKHFP